MSEEKIRGRIQAALATGKLPGVFDIPKVVALKSNLEKCDKSGDVAAMLDQNRVAIIKIFNISETELSACIRDIRAVAQHP